MEEILIVGTIVALLSPWVFLWISLGDRRRVEKLWRETLVYLRSSSANEAEDALARIGRREKTLLEKGLEKIRKQDENLAEDAGVDMAEDMRETLRKQYAATQD